jgi:hypothetical protein
MSPDESDDTPKKVARPMVIMMTEKIGSPTMGRRTRTSIKIPRTAEKTRVRKRRGQRDFELRDQGITDVGPASMSSPWAKLMMSVAL